MTASSLFVNIWNEAEQSRISVLAARLKVTWTPSVHTDRSKWWWSRYLRWILRQFFQREKSSKRQLKWTLSWELLSWIGLCFHIFYTCVFSNIWGTCAIEFASLSTSANTESQHRSQLHSFCCDKFLQAATVIDFHTHKKKPLLAVQAKSIIQRKTRSLMHKKMIN